jgi:hypothetical protein
MKSSSIKSRLFQSVDPNFDEHLPDMLLKGSAERPSYDLPSELRGKYQRMEGVKRKAAAVIRSKNEELAIEVRL